MHRHLSVGGQLPTHLPQLLTQWWCPGHATCSCVWKCEVHMCCTLHQAKSSHFSQAALCTIPFHMLKGSELVFWSPALAIRRTSQSRKQYICCRHKAAHHQGVTVRPMSHLCLGDTPKLRALWHLTRTDHLHILTAVLWAAGLASCHPAVAE